VCGGRERVGKLWGGAGFSRQVRGCEGGVRRTFGCLRVIRRHVVGGIEALEMRRESGSDTKAFEDALFALVPGE